MNRKMRTAAEKTGKWSVSLPKGIVACLLVCVLLLAAGCSMENGISPSASADDSSVIADAGSGGTVAVDVSGRMRADFLDIGKADCIVIRSDSQTAVVDTGYEDTSQTVLDYLESEGVEEIDYLILTHFDKDHVGGAAALIEAYDIGMILQPDYSADKEDSKPYRLYEAAVEKYDHNPVTVKETLTLIMEDIVFTIYPPEKLEYDSDKDNNRSLVTVVQHGDVRMLLAGDAEKERIDEILTGIPDLESDLLKVPHHGHEEKNSEELFKAADAQYAVICADRDDGKDGPDEDIIEALEDGGTEVFVTGDGIVQAVSDGKSLNVSQK